MSDSSSQSEFLEECEDGSLPIEDFKAMLGKNKKNAADNDNEALALVIGDNNFERVKELMQIPAVKAGSAKTFEDAVKEHYENTTGKNYRKNSSIIQNVLNDHDESRKILNELHRSFVQTIKGYENEEKWKMTSGWQMILLPNLGQNLYANHHEILRVSIEKNASAVYDLMLEPDLNTGEFKKDSAFAKSFKGEEGDISSQQILLTALKSKNEGLALKLLEVPKIAEGAVKSQPLINYVENKPEFKNFNDKLNVKRDEEFKKNKENKPVLFSGVLAHNKIGAEKPMLKKEEAVMPRKNTIARK